MDPGSLYESILGDAYPSLAAPLQRFHRLQGRHSLSGRVRTEPPTSWPACVVALLLGTPRERCEGPIRFELEAAPSQERWTRHFPTRRMVSSLRARDGRIVEHLGLARLTFRLAASEGRLHMHLERLHCLGVPCPRWAMPRVVAEETGRDERLHFHVQASMPGIGRVVKYVGHLELAGEGAR